MALHTARPSKTMDALFSAHFLHMRLSVALVWESILDGERFGDTGPRDSKEVSP